MKRGKRLLVMAVSALLALGLSGCIGAAGEEGEGHDAGDKRFVYDGRRGTARLL